MKKFHLTDYQLVIINNRLRMSSKDTEDYLLKKFGVFSIEELPATEYDSIIDEIEAFNFKPTANEDFDRAKR